MKVFIKLLYLTLTIGLLLSQNSYAQEEEYDSLLNYYLEQDEEFLDQLEMELAADSLDILDLIDSLLYGDFRFSQLSLRLGYTSDITYAGRNFGIQQYGFGLGVSYYHKSGLFGDLSGYWNSSLEPNYNPTIFTAGYLGNFTRKWTYTLSYDHFFYNVSDDELSYYPITNSLNSATFYELGKLTLAAEYSFLFGDEQAHRIRGNLMYTIAKNNWGFIDRFVFMPTASMLAGNSYVYQINPIFPEQNRQTRFELRQIMFDQYGEKLIKYLWHNERDRYLDLERITYNQNSDYFLEYELTSTNVFGIMNYTLSAPFYFYVNNFTFALSYHYNIPVALPGEELNIEPNSYAGATIIYNIPFLKKKK